MAHIFANAPFLNSVLSAANAGQMGIQLAAAPTVTDAADALAVIAGTLRDFEGDPADAQTVITGASQFVMDLPDRAVHHVHSKVVLGSAAVLGSFDAIRERLASSRTRSVYPNFAAVFEKYQESLRLDPNDSLNCRLPDEIFSLLEKMKAATGFSIESVMRLSILLLGTHKSDTEALHRKYISETSLLKYNRVCDFAVTHEEKAIMRSFCSLKSALLRFWISAAIFLLRDTISTAPEVVSMDSGLRRNDGPIGNDNLWPRIQVEIEKQLGESVLSITTVPDQPFVVVTASGKIFYLSFDLEQR